VGDKETIDNLNQVIQRLTTENAQTRRNIEKAQVILRRRAPNAAGLSLEASVKTILDDRDATRERITTFRQELSKALNLLFDDKIAEAIKQLNTFLFNNSR